MHRSSPIALVDHISAIRSTTLAWITAAGVVVPLVVTALTGPVVDVALVVGAVAGGVVGSGLVMVRQRVRNLPLELAGPACRAEVGGYPAYRFRVRLGRGRIFTQGKATVTWVNGQERLALPVVLDRVGLGVGPWTLLVVDTDRRIGTDGHFEVHVQVMEGQRSWQASADYPLATLVPGRFGSDLTAEGDGLAVDPDRWDVVTGEALA